MAALHQDRVGDRRRVDPTHRGRIPSLAARHGDFKGFTPAALTSLNDWHWPGNVRELENKLKRAVIMAENSLLDAADLDLGGKEAASLNLKFVREDADRKAIRLALARTEGKLSTSSKLLGDSRPTLYDLLKQYGIDA
jgi:two-component system NtrC family response regulator